MAHVAGDQSLGRRETQEDGFRIVPQSDSDPAGETLLLLADGMGGHAGGEVASRVALDAFAHHFQHVSSNMRPRGRLSEALTAANDALRGAVADDPALAGMGCTFIGALVTQGRVIWVSVGDSVVLLVRDGALKRLNADHSLFGELIEMAERGEITRAEAEAHPRRNALRSAPTGSTDPPAVIDLGAFALEAGDCLVLASDGLDTLDRHETASIVQATARDGAERIVAGVLDGVAARDQPQQDNTTVIALRQAGSARSSGFADSKWAFAERGPSRMPLPAVASGGLVLAAALLGVLLWVSDGGADDPGAPQVPEVDRAGADLREETGPGPDAAVPETTGPAADDQGGVVVDAPAPAPPAKDAPDDAPPAVVPPSDPSEAD